MGSIVTGFFYGTPVRSVCDRSEDSRWFFAEDICKALTRTKDEKLYWEILKSKSGKIGEMIRQIKLPEYDRKFIMTDLVNIGGVEMIAASTTSCLSTDMISWVKCAGSTADDRCKQKAYELFDCVNPDMGTSGGLRQIHKYIFDGRYENAGKFRAAKDCDIKKYIDEIIKLPDKSVEDIALKFSKMTVCVPFERGTGRCVRIWLDMYLRRRFNLCMDWSKADKNRYNNAMLNAAVRLAPLCVLFDKAISDDINNRDLFIKSIDYSFYLDEDEENNDEERIRTRFIGSMVKVEKVQSYDRQASL